MNTDMPAVGFIGLGLMGSRMASRLQGAGYPLTVYNRTRERTEPFARRGGQVANIPAELARAVDVVMLSVTDDAALEGIMRGADGVLAGVHDGVTVIDLSSVSPAISRTLAKEVGEKGGSMLDAPVSGSTPQAEQGALNILVGGDEDTYRRCQPILKVLGEQFYLGPNGMGLVMKLVVNTLLGVGVQSLAEALVLGEGAGLERDRCLEVLGHMVVVSPAQKSKLENFRNDSYPTSFPLQHMDKDYGLIAELAAERHVAMPAAEAAHQMTKAARAQGLEEDFSVVIRVMERLAGIDREASAD
jgi:3-hydroxyisobutyrate dehydrogenase-like beta-hydroxyacid dehydrogenase